MLIPTTPGEVNQLLADTHNAAARLRHLEAERSEVTAVLDDCIAHLREADVTWAKINEVTGAANMQMSWTRRQNTNQNTNQKET